MKGGHSWSDDEDMISNEQSRGKEKPDREATHPSRLEKLRRHAADERYALELCDLQELILRIDRGSIEVVG